MIKDDDIIEIKYSDKYERMFKREKIITPFLVLPAFIVLFLLGASIKFILLMIPVALVMILIMLMAEISSEGNLTNKICINNKGMYVWRRNKKEEFISWDTVNEFHKMDVKSSDDYIIFYKKKIGYNLSPTKRGYSELALDFNSAQIAMKKFNEYKAQLGVK